jgi:hypothetical protein
LVWLLIYATCSFFPIRFLVDKGLAVVRYLSLTEIGSLLRADLQVITEHPYLLSFTFIIYGYLSMWLVRWYCHVVECAICLASYLLSFTFIIYGFLSMLLVGWYCHGVQCAICLESYKWLDQTCGLPCGHNFHKHCIMKWLHEYRRNCPICRQPA